MVASCDDIDQRAAPHVRRLTFGQLGLQLENGLVEIFLSMCGTLVLASCGLGERRQQAGCVAVAALLTEWRAALASQLACTQTRVALTPALAHLCAVLAVYSRSCGPAADTGAPVAGALP